MNMIKIASGQLKRIWLNTDPAIPAPWIVERPEDDGGGMTKHPMTYHAKSFWINGNSFSNGTRGQPLHPAGPDLVLETYAEVELSI